MTQALTFKNGQFVLTKNETAEIVSLKTAVTQRAYADDVAKRVIKRLLVQRYQAPTLPSSLLSFLDAHQLDGINWILTRQRSYLAHAPGAGKTAQAIIAALLTKSERVLFIVPPSLTVNWSREIMKWTAWADIFPSIAIVPGSDEKDKLDWRAEFIICPDSMLDRAWVLKHLIKYRAQFVAVDEASRFKDPSANRTKALFGGRLSDTLTSPGLVQDARHSVLLDGSPMPNRSIELWAPTFAMSAESINFKSYDDFGYRYGGPTINERGVWEYKHNSNSAELKEKLQKSFMHVVSESALKHPERRRSMVIMNADVRTPEIKAWEKSNIEKISAGKINDQTPGAAATMRKELGLRKVDFVASHARAALEKNESIIIFAWHREVIFELSHKLKDIQHDIIMGQTAMQFRELAFADFQSGKSKLIIGNILAMGRGNNLQRGDKVVFAEWSWSNETNIQAEKRVSRRGNEKAFTRCEYIVCPNSMDEIVLRSVFSKEQAVKNVIA